MLALFKDACLDGPRGLPGLLSSKCLGVEGVKGMAFGFPRRTLLLRLGAEMGPEMDSA